MIINKVYHDTKSERQQEHVVFPFPSLCLWVKVSMQALLIMVFQVSSDLHSVDASLFTTFDVHKNTLDLYVSVLSGVGHGRLDIICAPK